MRHPAHNSSASPRAPRQSFERGAIVRVGFIADLQVHARVGTPGDYRPDFYVLRHAHTGAWYAFQPHHGGLVRCDSESDAAQAF
jgi:hypothetical protein